MGLLEDMELEVEEVHMDVGREAGTGAMLLSWETWSAVRGREREESLGMIREVWGSIVGGWCVVSELWLSKEVVVGCARCSV